MAKIGIIGGGISGLCSAWYLSRSGHDVSVLDMDDMQKGCSWGNAGMIVPSHFIPLAAPGMIGKGIRWMFKSTSPFYVRPRLDIDLFKWGWHFYRNSTHQKVEEAAPVLRDLSLLSKRCYHELASELPIDVHDRGLLMLYRKQETGNEEMETVEMAHKLGMEARSLSPAEVQSLEPNIKVDALGGIYFPGDMHLSPASLMTALISALGSNGVNLERNTTVLGFQFSDQRITAIETPRGSMVFDQIVLAAGAWSQQVGASLRLNLPIQAGKGYSFMVKQSDQRISIPTLLLDDRVAVTPIGDEVRFGGTLEIGGLDHSINMKRVQGIVDAIPRYYPQLRIKSPAASNVWYGFRPCSPDGLPFIGRSSSIDNLLVATGHGLMGVSLGPATGRVISDLINEVPAEVNLRALDPERFK